MKLFSIIFLLGFLTIPNYIFAQSPTAQDAIAYIRKSIIESIKRDYIVDNYFKYIKDKAKLSCMKNLYLTHSIIAIIS